MPPKRPLARVLAHVAIAAYVGLQIALPLPGLLRGFHETDGYISWNMFAHHYACDGWYTVVRRDGSRLHLDPRDHVRDGEGALHRIFHRDALRLYHRWLCESLVPPGARLLGRMDCALRPGEPVALVARDVDLCSAEEFGVLRDGG
jgi:hypothetical protein